MMVQHILASAMMLTGVSIAHGLDGAVERQPQAASPNAVEVMVDHAKKLHEVSSTELGRAFLREVTRLPAVPSRTMWRDTATRREWMSSSAAEAMSEHDRSAYEELTINDSIYYNTKYGSPLAYVRTVDVLASHGMMSLEGRTVLDYGYGSVGHLRLLALLGAHAVGVDVDPFLAALYSSPEDQGAVKRLDGRDGAITLLHGRWPAEASVIAAIEHKGPVDIFLSKNTLKKGYVTPDLPREQIDPRMLIDLGVTPEAYLAALRSVVRPGGLVVIYNLCPAHPAGGYSPMADGRSPWTEAEWIAAGFEVLSFDVDDHGPARAMGKALGWDQGPRPMDLEAGLFAWYTVVRRTENAQTSPIRPPGGGDAQSAGK
ncbi:MAG: hypothetical protein KF866_08435 [Phycisphaeraceae bacterium]|nr:hypothetical protein [Phycisphaeraceae bacterium]MCW5753904.1 hypothetical protein [Phycisphaeraceae bacterium]